MCYCKSVLSEIYYQESLRSFLNWWSLYIRVIFKFCCAVLFLSDYEHLGQSTRRFSIPRAFDAFVVPGGGEFDHYTYGVGNLNCNLDFVLCVPVSDRGLINHGGGQHAVRYGEFKDFKIKDCRFVTTWIKSEGLHRLFSVFKTCLQTWRVNKFSEKSIFSDLKWIYGGAFERLFGLGRGILNTNFSIIQMPGVLPGEILKLRFNWHISNTCPYQVL